MLFFFNDTATTEIYTLSLHDALPISVDDLGASCRPHSHKGVAETLRVHRRSAFATPLWLRSEEHTSELQSHLNLVCRLLLEKKNKDSLTAAKHHLRPLM